MTMTKIDSLPKNTPQYQSISNIKITANIKQSFTLISPIYT